MFTIKDKVLLVQNSVYKRILCLTLHSDFRQLNIPEYCLLWYQMEGQVKSTIRIKIWNQVNKQIGQQVFNTIWNQFDDQCKK